MFCDQLFGRIVESWLTVWGARWNVAWSGNESRSYCIRWWFGCPTVEGSAPLYDFASMAEVKL